jgi:hypothetical protein
MDDVIDDIDRATRRCDRASRRLNDEPSKSVLKRLGEAISALSDASSGSWIGYQASVYTADLQPKRPGEHFDSMHGGPGGYSTGEVREWAEFAYETILEAARDMAGVSKEDLDEVSAVAHEIASTVEECRNDLLPTFDAILSTKDGRSPLHPEQQRPGKAGRILLGSAGRIGAGVSRARPAATLHHGHGSGGSHGRSMPAAARRARPARRVAAAVASFDKLRTGSMDRRRWRTDDRCTSRCSPPASGQ